MSLSKHVVENDMPFSMSRKWYAILYEGEWVSRKATKELELFVVLWLWEQRKEWTAQIPR